ncbi:type II toxin-antitoxin system HipA family toxin [Haliea atlantica]
MRSYLARQAGVNPVREFFLLWVLGRDLPGAVTVRPTDGESWPPETAEGGDEDNERHEMALRFSLAGVQLKFSAVQEAAGGLTIPAKGVGGSWIVKLPSTQFEGVPENEYAMMTLAGQIGMDVPEVRLIDLKDIGNLPSGIGSLKGKALAVRRFDRKADGSPVHIEDFAQIFGVYPGDKYEKASYRNIANVIGAEGSDADIAEFIRRLTYNTLIGNADMHLKNWSMIYKDRRSAALSPAYDLVSTIAFMPDNKAALNFSRTKRFDGFTQDELSHLAAKARLPETLTLRTAQETAAQFHEQWQKDRNHLGLTSEMIESLDKHLKSLPPL